MKPVSEQMWEWHQRNCTRLEEENAKLQLLVESNNKLVSDLREHLALALSFAPKGPVPQGLGPEFYHTLDYSEEVKLQERIDKARAALGEK